MSTCPCGSPTHGWLCNPCLDTFKDHVRRVPGVLIDLQVTARRQDVHGGNGSGGTTGSKPPINLTAMTLHTDIEVMLRTLYRHTGGNGEPADRVMAARTTNPTNFPHLAAKACVIEYAHQLPRLLNQATMLIDTPPNTVKLGTCPTRFCGTELTAQENDTETSCPTCGHTLNIHTHRLRRILAALGEDGQPVRASEAVRRFNHAGLPLTPMNIKNWVTRRQLHPTGTDEHQRRLYNITDIYTLTTKQIQNHTVKD